MKSNSDDIAIKSLVDMIKKNKEKDKIILAYQIHTGLIPIKCSCNDDNVDKNCKKCCGTGYILKKEERNERSSII